MTLRKGQFFFNQIISNHKLHDHNCTMNKGGDIFPYYNLHEIIYYMDDKEFDRILQAYEKLKRDNIP